MMEELFSDPAVGDFPVSLHLAMIRDKVRMKAFHQALKASIRPGDTVVDIGTGTGVLAILAARCGAGKVVGFDRSDIIREARRIKAQNCPDAPITFHARDILTDELPNVRADVLVCELLGNFGIDENMIEVLSVARKRLLKPGGQIIPQDMQLRMAPVQCTQAYKEAVSWRRREWGIDFSALQNRAHHCVYHLSSEWVRALAAPGVLSHLEFANVERLEKHSSLNFEFDRAGTLHGIAGWFRATLAPGVVLNTGPRKPPTHWGQVFFPIGEPVKVRAGGSLHVHFSERIVGSEVRWRWKGTIRPAGGNAALTSFNFHAAREFSELLDV